MNQPKGTMKAKRPLSDRAFVEGGLNGGRFVPLRQNTIREDPLSRTSFRVNVLRRELEFQRGEIRRHKHIVRLMKNALEEQLDMWRLGMNQNEWPTIGQVYHLIKKLENAIEYASKG